MKGNSFLISAVFLLFSCMGTAQDFIGMQADEIKKQMRAGHKDFALDETTKNRVYKYLKYVDEVGSRTILFFLSEEDTCTFYKILYENDLYGPVVRELERTCEKVSDTLWIQTLDGKKYSKVLKRRDWFFSVTTRPVPGNVPEKKEQ